MGWDVMTSVSISYIQSTASKLCIITLESKVSQTHTCHWNCVDTFQHYLTDAAVCLRYSVA